MESRNREWSVGLKEIKKFRWLKHPLPDASNCVEGLELGGEGAEWGL